MADSHPVTNGEWRLRLYGEFELVNPEGNRIKLTSRKAEALLAVLAVHPALGLSRDELGEILWPEKDGSSRRTNLRQALTQLRRSIGDAAIESSRSHCRLSSSICLRADYNSDEPKSGGFMPGHDGEWFETIRSFSSPENASQRVPISVVDSFAQMLSWFADNDPKALATIVRASGSLVRGIAPTQMLRLLHVAGKNALPRGWYAYWKGAMEDDLRVSMSWLESALPEAAREGDDQLAAESALELGKVYSRTGHLDSAKRMISLTERLAEKTASPVARVKAARLKGAVLSHWGDPIEGIACMKVAEELLTDQMERASVRATRGLFELVSGQEGRALDTLAHPNALLAETGHWLLELNCGLANALLKSKGGGFKDTIPELEQFAARSYALGCTQYGVYADELLARAHRLDGDRSESDARRRSALSGRKAAFMARTPWETRLARSLG